MAPALAHIFTVAFRKQSPSPSRRPEASTNNHPPPVPVPHGLPPGSAVQDVTLLSTFGDSINKELTLLGLITRITALEACNTTLFALVDKVINQITALRFEVHILDDDF